MLLINRKNLLANISMKECIDLMQDILGNLSEGKAVEILRKAIGLEDGNIFALMPSYIISKKIAGVKVISVFHENFKKNLPSHQGVVLLFETETGKPIGLVDGGGITAIRTAAVSAAATRHLSRKNSKILAILGAGVQAREHLRAMMQVRDIKEVKVWSVFYDEALKYSEEMTKEVKVKIIPVESAEEAVNKADIICTVTASKKPILKGSWVSPGTHINAVGACAPNDRELDTDIVVKSKLFVDRMESTLNEAGDFLIPFKEGALDESHIIGEIGSVFKGTLKGRTADNDITIFEALGLAVEDIACAYFVYEKIKDEAMNINLLG